MEEKVAKHIDLQNYKKRYSNYYFNRAIYYTDKKIQEIEDWCNLMIKNDFKIVNWYGECSDHIGFIIQEKEDQLLFKLTWEGVGTTEDYILDEIFDEDEHYEEEENT